MHLYETSVHVFAPLAVQLAEITTPFLHFRWYLSTLGYKTSKLYIANGLMLVFLFLIVRGGLMTYMVYRIWVVAGIIPKV